MVYTISESALTISEAGQKTCSRRSARQKISEVARQNRGGLLPLGCRLSRQLMEFGAAIVFGNTPARTDESLLLRYGWYLHTSLRYPWTPVPS